MGMNPLNIANLMAKAAQSKASQPNDQDADDMPGKKNPKQVAAAKEQEKAKGKIPPKAAAQARANMPKPEKM